VTVATAAAPRPRGGPWLVLWAAVALAMVLPLAMAAPDSPMLIYPSAWEAPFKTWISVAMKWLIERCDLGLFTFKELTRGIAFVLQGPLDLARAVLLDGLALPSPGGALVLPPLSWLSLTLVMGYTGLRAGGPGLGLLVGGCFLYLAVFGWWESAMVTLSSIAIAVPLGVAAGMALGIVGFRRRWFERAMTPVLDLMQTVPVFAYLVPVLFLFGFGPVSAMIATIVYALPPMVRVTILALRQVAGEVVEFGRMAGCSRRQLLWKVLVPSARPGLMVGVNQVIMLSLNMVIIASMIGAGGLGFDVLDSLKRLDIGKGLEAGLSITLLAVALDRLSQAFARRTATHGPASRLRRGLPALAFLAFLVAPTVAGLFVPALARYPEAWHVTTGPIWADLVEAINVRYFDDLEAVKSVLLVEVLVPVKRALSALPWVAVVAAAALAGWQLGRARLALLAGLLVLFIAVSGNWEKAMITVYLVGVSVILATLIGLPVGIAAAGSPGFNRLVQIVIDTLQTLPTFVYLIPVVMLFQVGDFSAIIAIVAYAVVPAIRYTVLGLASVPATLLEAARSQGCSRTQTLLKVRLPLAFPELMLGLNQTVMMALSMLVITALVGTRDLGQEVYIALSKADTGRGLVSGLCVAFIAIASDRLIGAAAARKRRSLGLAA
jgi:glycine betaine/proline transport system permease protein